MGTRQAVLLLAAMATALLLASGVAWAATNYISCTAGVVCEGTNTQDPHDRINGSEGDDIMYAKGGNDYLDGYGGSDQMNGERGDDTIYGFDGNDTMDGGAGYDDLQGLNHPDTLIR